MNFENNKNNEENIQAKVYAKKSVSETTNANIDLKGNNYLVVPISIFTVVMTIFLGAALVNKSCQQNFVNSQNLTELHYGGHVSLSTCHTLKHLNLEPDTNICSNNIKSNVQNDDGDDQRRQSLIKKLHRSSILKRNLRKKMAKNWNGRYKSKRVKGVQKTNNDNRDQQLAKKATSAEAIIYFFALTFIYLLLKAASDINQHFKSNVKGDKQMRRCSLQSYAQAHRQERRASKGINTKSAFKV